jgi:ribonuclease BN (tRNA processing enzyme)
MDVPEGRTAIAAWPQHSTADGRSMASDTHRYDPEGRDDRPLLMILGTQGWIPTPRRATTCLAYRDGATLLILDAGTGLGRFLRPPAASLLDGVDEVHLLLTHYHLDHTVGLSYLSGVFPQLRVTVHVPEAAVNGVEPPDGVPSLIRPPFFPDAWARQKRVSLSTVSTGENDVAGQRVVVRAQSHADVSVAYRVVDHFVLATDTVYDEATAAFATGAEVLVHEAWIDGKEEGEPGREDMVRHAYASHTSARQAARLAARAGVEELLLVHLNPLFDEDYYAEQGRSARAVFPHTTVPDDLHVRELARY